jgi:hypothetical protein
VPGEESAVSGGLHMPRQRHFYESGTAAIYAYLNRPLLLQGGFLQFLKHAEETHKLNRSVSTAVNGSFVQQWPFDETSIKRKFQNWFLRFCTRASYDGNVFISRLLKLDKETESLLS